MPLVPQAISSGVPLVPQAISSGVPLVVSNFRSSQASLCSIDGEFSGSDYFSSVSLPWVLILKGGKKP